MSQQIILKFLFNDDHQMTFKANQQIYLKQFTQKTTVQSINFIGLQLLGGLLHVVSRDVIRSPDIRTFESRSEVRTQIQHPEVRLKYQNAQRCTISFRKYCKIITERGNMTSSRSSDFADKNTTTGDNCRRCVFV